MLLNILLSDTLWMIMKYLPKNRLITYILSHILSNKWTKISSGMSSNLKFSLNIIYIYLKSRYLHIANI